MYGIFVTAMLVMLVLLQGILHYVLNKRIIRIYHMVFLLPYCSRTADDIDSILKNDI